MPKEHHTSMHCTDASPSNSNITKAEQLLHTLASKNRVFFFMIDNRILDLDLLEVNGRKCGLLKRLELLCLSLLDLKNESDNCLCCSY